MLGQQSRSTGKELSKYCQESLEIDFVDLWDSIPVLAEWLADAPSELLNLLDEITFREVTNNHAFPDYGRIHPEVHVRVSNLPMTTLIRELRWVPHYSLLTS